MGLEWGRNVVFLGDKPNKHLERSSFRERKSLWIWGQSFLHIKLFQYAFQNFFYCIFCLFFRLTLLFFNIVGLEVGLLLPRFWLFIFFWYKFSIFFKLILFEDFQKIIKDVEPIIEKIIPNPFVKYNLKAITFPFSDKFIFVLKPIKYCFIININKKLYIYK